MSVRNKSLTSNVILTPGAGVRHVRQDSNFDLMIDGTPGKHQSSENSYYKEQCLHQIVCQSFQ